MDRDPDILLVGQPTRGVDIGAIEFIHRRLVAMRDSGKAVLLVSVELDEIMSLSDRILVMFNGEIVGEVIVGDANLCEVATLLKLGTTAIVLAMVEDGTLDDGVSLADPVQALQRVSWDTGLSAPLLLEDGRTATALDLQWELLESAQKYLLEQGDEMVGGAVAGEVVGRWEGVLTALESSPSELFGVLDWVTKRSLLDGYRERHGLEAEDVRLAAMDLQYHDLRPGRSLFARVGAERVVDVDDVARAVEDPPADTRAYFRGRCLQRWPDRVVAANWDSMVFDTGEDSLRRVPMMEPARGTSDHVGTLLDECHTVTELLDRLSENPIAGPDD